VELIQTNVKSRIQEFAIHLRKVFNEIDSSLNPNIVSDLEKSIETQYADLEKITKGKEEKQAIVAKLKETVYKNQYDKLTKKVETVTKALKKLKSELKKKGRESKQLSERYRSDFEKVKEILTGTYTDHLRIKGVLEVLLPPSHDLLIQWESIDLLAILDQFELPEHLYSIILRISEWLVNEIDEIFANDSFTSARFFEELLDLIGRYKEYNITLPTLGTSFEAVIV